MTQLKNTLEKNMLKALNQLEITDGVDEKLRLFFRLESDLRDYAELAGWSETQCEDELENKGE